MTQLEEGVKWGSLQGWKSLMQKAARLLRDLGWKQVAETGLLGPPAPHATVWP